VLHLHEFDSYRVIVLLAGEVLGFENLVLGIFDFVHALIETPRHRSLMKKYVEQLIYYVFHYMQMTEEQVIWIALHTFSQPTSRNVCKKFSSKAIYLMLLRPVKQRIDYV